MRPMHSVEAAPRGHWVGDGFPVRSLISHHTHGTAISPFLLLDYAGPATFNAADKARGVGEHPHRGFETVTIVYQGELEHRDSAGNSGKIGPGDVQWMTAASGVLHEEFHSPEFTRNGGVLEMVQLWVNLPAKDKMASPGYQTLMAADILSVPLADGAGTLRVIAGEYEGHKGPARTFTPVNVFDVRLNRDGRVRLSPPGDHTALAIVLSGTVLVNGEDVAREAQVVRFETADGDITLEANNEAKVLVLTGAPINEPVAAYGPFVMNTTDEIRQAIEDLNHGKFGALSS